MGIHPLAIAGATAALLLASIAAAQGDDGARLLGVGQSPPSAESSSYHRWARGQVLPPESRTAPITDYAALHLRRPPQGYQWYRCGDQFVLAAITSGMIFEVIDGG